MLIPNLILGFVVGFIGGSRGWSLVRVLIVSFLASLVFNCLIASRANASVAQDNLRRATVMVNGLSCSGSGSLVQARSGKTYLLTNAHVCMCAEFKGDVFATFDDGHLLQAKVIKKDVQKDLCAAQVDAPDFYLKMAPQLLPLTEVNTRGYPMGRLTESHGIVKGSIEWDYDMDIQKVGICPKGTQKGINYRGVVSVCRIHFVSTLSNLYARPGSSGSAVVNDQGELVGVVSSFHPTDEYNAGLVQFNDVRDFLSKL